jgi:hypothetical protein
VRCSTLCGNTLPAIEWEIKDASPRGHPRAGGGPMLYKCLEPYPPGTLSRLSTGATYKT